MSHTHMSNNLDKIIQLISIEQVRCLMKQMKIDDNSFSESEAPISEATKSEATKSEANAKSEGGKSKVVKKPVKPRLKKKEEPQVAVYVEELTEDPYF